MNIRACGKADHVHARVILDDTDTAERIPKDAKGRFITGARDCVFSV